MAANRAPETARNNAIATGMSRTKRFMCTCPRENADAESSPPATPRSRRTLQVKSTCLDMEQFFWRRIDWRHRRVQAPIPRKDFLDRCQLGCRPAEGDIAFLIDFRKCVFGTNAFLIETTPLVQPGAEIYSRTTTSENSRLRNSIPDTAQSSILVASPSGRRQLTRYSCQN